MTDQERKKLEDALKTLHFLDEPVLDTRLLGLSILPNCTKDCQGGHCGGKAPDCDPRRICDGKCLQQGGCLQNSNKWCAHQEPGCASKGMCSPKCQERGLPI